MFPRLVSLAFIFLWFLSVSARPIPAQLDAPTTVHTVHTTQTSDGPVTETCDITLTPITDDNGRPAIQEVTKCSLAFADAGPQESGVTTTATISPPGTTALPSPSTTATVVSQTVTQNIPTAPVPSSSTGDRPSTTLATPTVSPPSPTSLGSGTSAPDSSTSAFQLPGKTLSVLPIGLGVFAGISVIALVVVGLVTYERTRYRKAFRQRKLAESGAGMGYGGMAQRP